MDETHPGPDHLFRRMPGLFRRWELAQIVEAGKDYHVEDAGSACDGTTLYAVYVTPPAAPEAEATRQQALRKSCAAVPEAGAAVFERTPGLRSKKGAQ